MKRINQPEEDARYTRGYLYEQTENSLPSKALFQDRPNSTLGLNKSGYEPGSAARGYSQPASASANTHRRYARQNDYLTYDTNRQQASVPVNQQKAVGSTRPNIYLGGRTGSFGPYGCSAAQTKYSFGRYPKKEENTDTPDEQ
ncbi:hypothetical protein [Pontibacter chitinilyticus]|uniref:hypothetical protein n=1 Tax=Pontibacter chitinilyticus TaxID=2674989 RepID=UPI0032197A7C